MVASRHIVAQTQCLEWNRDDNTTLSSNIFRKLNLYNLPGKKIHTNTQTRTQHTSGSASDIGIIHLKQLYTEIHALTHEELTQIFSLIV
jgi:hypothetical protein